MHSVDVPLSEAKTRLMSKDQGKSGGRVRYNAAPISDLHGYITHLKKCFQSKDVLDQLLQRLAACA